MASSGSPNNRLALLAGTGQLPALVARQARDQGHEVMAFGFEGMMDPDLAGCCAAALAFPFCQLGKIFGRIKAEGIKKAVTIGSVAQTSMVDGPPRFDDLAVELWKRVPDLRVDSVMRVLVEELESRGIKVLAAADFLANHFAPAGTLTKKAPSPSQRDDIRFGFRMAKAIGGLDIGQTVVVKDRAVMAVEAVEGTDQAILRGGALARGGAVVVKVAKPGQDMRFDVPAAGRDTLESMRQAGAEVLALEAGKVLLVEKDEIVRWAEEAGICLVGARPDEWGGDDV